MQHAEHGVDLAQGAGGEVAIAGSEAVLLDRRVEVAHETEHRGERGRDVEVVAQRRGEVARQAIGGGAHVAAIRALLARVRESEAQVVDATQRRGRLPRPKPKVKLSFLRYGTESSA